MFTTEELSAAGNWESRVRVELVAADIVVALLTPRSVESSWVLLEIGAAWALEKLILPVISRRDVLNRLPVHLQGAPAIEVADVESSRNAEKFMRAFEDSLAFAHTA